MATSYTTKAGDQWDAIAKTVYSSELAADWLMENNLNYIDIFQFDAGAILQTPALPDSKSGALPPWRTTQ